MEKFNKFINLLHSGLSQLALPFDDTPKTVIDSNGTLLTITRRPEELYFILPFSNGTFLEALEAYNSKCRILIQQCDKMHFEQVSFNNPMDIMESYYKLKQVRVLDPAIFELFWKKNKLFIIPMNNSKVEREYHDLHLNWCNLYHIIFQMRSELFEGIDKHLNNIFKVGDNNEALSNNNEDKTFVFPRRFSKNSADIINSRLIKNGFIDPSTTEEDFYIVFSLSVNRGKFKPIKWIKKNQRVANGKINRLSLIDFLTLLGYVKQDILLDKGMMYKRLNNCFILDSGPFKSNDFSAAMKNAERNLPLHVESEFHEDLVSLLDGVGLPSREDIS